jgi:NTP pyrophosphatase (non-canonical NTP hydrolase)
MSELREAIAEKGVRKMKSEYEPITIQQRLGYLIEECGEVLAAAGKSLRWGLGSVNPEIPASEQETNADWLRRELNDLEGAIQRVRTLLEPTP